MKINIDVKKGAEAVSGFLQKSSDIGKKISTEVQAGAVALSEKTKQESYVRRMKKYNPLFPEVYFGAEFTLPNMIMIRDDAERRGIDVCEGAIGWLGKEGSMEVLYLYDEFVPECGLKFVPSVDCDAIYYVDSFDRSRFIRIDCIFSKAHEERLAELKDVAYSLGAKSCTIEISESSVEVNTAHKKASVGVSSVVHGAKVSSAESADQEVAAKNAAHRSGTIRIEFEGNATPRRPELKWFAHEETVKKLIDMRMSGDNSIKTEVLTLSGSSSSTMSQKTAYAIDNAVGAMKVKGNSSMESQAVRENQSSLLFSIEF